MRFVTLVKFTPAGFANIDGSPRRAKAFVDSATAAGVKIQELLWTQGEYDGVILFEAESVEKAAATMLKAASEGHVQTQTMVAFDANAIDKIIAGS